MQRADILGNRTFAMRIWLKPDQMAALGISPSTVRDALASNNYLSALGSTKGSMVSVNLVANTDLRTPEEFRQMVIKQQNGVVVRLGEIADVALGAENYDARRPLQRRNGDLHGRLGTADCQFAGSDQACAGGIPGIQRAAPTGMKVGIPYDSTAYIQDAINEVLHTLTETLLIVVVVIFLFLGSFRSVLIPVVAIPISLIGAVFLMLVAGFTINLLTLLAIVLSVGLVVDDAIVMVENVERHLQMGKSPMQAAIDAARELVGPIIAMTITLAAVYAPIGIQGGLTGALFREFAFTLAGAVIVSGIVALTLSPMMGSKLLRAGDTERGFAGMDQSPLRSMCATAIRELLAGTLQYRPVVLTLWAIVVLLMVPFYMFSQRELAPAEDQGVVFGVIQASPNSTIDQTNLFTKQVYDVYKSFPESAEHFPDHTSDRRLRRHGDQTVERAQEDDAATPDGSRRGPLSKIAGIRVIPLTPPPLPGGGNFPVDFVIASAAEPQQLVDFANQLVQKGIRERHVHLCRLGLEIRPAADRSGLRSRQAALAGSGPEPGGPGSFHDAGRKLRQPLQHSGTQLQGHSAGEARRASDAGPALADLRHGIGGQAGSALNVRHV